MTVKNELDNEICLYIGAILHDIGKVRQRYEKNNTHSYYSKEFVDELTILNDDSRKDLVSKLVLNHHTNNIKDSELSVEEWALLDILKLADRTSASHDRNDHDPERTPSSDERGDRMKKIFSNLIVPEGGGSESGKDANTEHSQNRKFRSVPLVDGVENYYKLLTLEQLADVKKEYGRPLQFTKAEFSLKKLNEDILKRINSIAIQGSSYDSWSNFFNSLDSVLMNYLTFVPSAFYYDPPNITLYDHLKLTASLSNVIYRSKERSKDAPLMFIMGSASGIQKYIFNRSLSESVDEKGTKRIRGRSFYVRLYTEAIVNRILEGLSLYRFNVIMQKTDGFIIIAPRTEENLERIRAIRKDIELFTEVSSRGLKMSIGWTEGTVKDLENDDDPENKKDISEFSKILEKLSSSVSKRKMQTLSDDRSNFYETIRPRKMPFNFFCRKCGRSEVKKRGDGCEFCKNEEYLGEKLPKSDERFIVGSKILFPESDHGPIKFIFGEWEYYYYIIERDNIKKVGQNDEILCINRLSVDNRQNFRLILQGFFSPMDRNGVISINDNLRTNQSEGRDYRYLAMNKSDVDNMGLLINYGYKNLTISKYASTSLLLTTFFSVFSNIIAEKHSVYIVYAGGDDVIAIGQENRVIEFSFDFQEAFDEWVSGKMTLSTGIEIVHHKFPVLKLVDMTEEQLERSKKMGMINKDEKQLKTSKKMAKDSINIIGIVAPWEQAKKQYEVSNCIYGIVGGKEQKLDQGAMLSDSFCNYIIDVQKHSIKSAQPTKGMRLVYPDYMIAYYVRRNWKMKDENSIRERENFLKKILEEDTMEGLEMAATLTILKRRWE